MARKFIPVLGPETTESPDLEGTASFAYENGVRFRNGYLEINQAAQDNSGKIEFIKRPGISSTALNNPALVGTESPNIHGIFTNNFGNTPIVLWGKLSGGLYSHQVTYGTTVIAAPAGWYSSAVQQKLDGMVTPLDSNIFAGNIAAITVTGYAGLLTSAGAAWNRITDADWTGVFASAAHTEFAAMDGYLFQATAACKVYNSDLNTPSSWTSTGYITSAIYPGSAVSLKRFRQYLILFKTDSVEFLENQGNPTPGSPLGLVKNLAQPIGCFGSPLFQSVGEVSDGFVWIGKSATGLRGIYKLGVDLQARKISDSFIDVMLAKASLPTTVTVMPFKNHEFVIMSITNGSVVRSLVYDNSNGTWNEWTTNGIGFSTSSYCMIDVSGDTYLSVPYAVSATNGVLRKVASDQYGDYDVTSATTKAIDFRWITPRLDFGMWRRKFASLLEVGYSMFGGPSVTLSSTNVSMYYYDDDAALSGSATISKSATQVGTGRLIWRRLGSFYRRRFVIGTNDSTNPMRFHGMEIDIDAAEDEIA